MKRTLTDEQIAMFRHSEIQAILRKRRLRRENDEPHEEGETLHSLVQRSESVSARTTPDSSHPITPAMEPAIGNAGRSHKIPSDRAGKTQPQQWATSSARTKARNKKHNQKYRRKKRDERKRKEAKGSGGDDGESDEWDPWHQANGPDVQKDTALDLDY